MLHTIVVRHYFCLKVGSSPYFFQKKSSSILKQNIKRPFKIHFPEYIRKFAQKEILSQCTIKAAGHVAIENQTD